MTITVSSDLSVNTVPTRVEEKLEDKQKALRKSIEKGQPKIFGVSQLVIGLMIITYSTPLYFSEFTLLLKCGVPWWSGPMFVISGVFALGIEKHGTIKAVSACLAVSVVAIIISVIALILYYVDIISNPATECHKNPDESCDHRHYTTHFITGVKTALSLMNVVQTAMSTAFTVMLFNQRRAFGGYAAVNE